MRFRCGNSLIKKVDSKRKFMISLAGKEKKEAKTAKQNENTEADQK